MIICTKRCLGSLLVSALFFIHVGQLASQQLERIPYRLDAGAVDSELSNHALHLTPRMNPDARSGFGWMQPPDRAFIREDLRRSRNDFTIDGVEGTSLELMAKLPPGKWWVTLWIEAGLEDSSTVILHIAGKGVTTNWHAFQPPAESRSAPQVIFRVYHGPAMVAGDGLLLSLRSDAHPVQLLGVTFMPDPTEGTEGQRQLSQRMVEAGRYGETTPLQPLLQELNKAGPSNAFSAYWSQQIALLRQAEIHFEKRGWEAEKLASGLGIFDRLHQAVMILDGLLNHPGAESNPFYERALFLRGRLLYWLALERGGPNEFAGGNRDLQKLYGRHPDDKLLAMYNGEKIDLPDSCDHLVPSPGAPEWSKAQRELLCRMSDIAHWWVRERQAPNGEFGGKIGDDVELLRWWTPLVLAGDTLALHGWRRLADGVLQNDKVYKGYSREALDVEHASEFISDTAPGMVVYSDDPVYLERLRYPADYFTGLWTGKSQSGQRFFKSAWYSSTEVDETPPKNRDVEYNCRATKAVRYFAWKTADPEVIQALHEWSVAWRDVAMSSNKGKPPGLIPASMRFPDGAINGDGSNWYEAGMYWDYFDWEHNAGGMMLDQLLFTYTLTKDERLLHPLLYTFDFLRSYIGKGATGRGSANWAASILRQNETFWSVAAQWRLLTGDNRYDDLLLKHGTPYLRYRLSGDERYLVEALDKSLEEVRFNTPLKTSEAIHTDRVYVPGYESLKAMLTGDGIAEGLSPYLAVSWEHTDKGFTALVTNATDQELSAQIYSHAQKGGEVIARLWQLAPGRYLVLVSDTVERRILKDSVIVSAKGQRYSFILPPRKLIEIDIKKVE